MKSDLPVAKIIPDFREALTSGDALVVTAAPGAGKTTLLPAELLTLVPGKIYLTEPRRIAARAAASWIAANLGETPGKTVGYAVRGDSKYSASTRLFAVTPGVMLQKLRSDPFLEDTDAIIFDEFHERQWEVDLALSLALESQKLAGKKIKIVIMSATIDSAGIAAFLNAKILDAPGKSFPVETIWQNGAPDPRDAANLCATATAQALAGNSGDILVFLPGVAEIRRCAEALESRILSNDIEILQLHGELPLKDQQKILSPHDDGKTRVILATNIAESSVTVPGVRTVIDSGWEKHPHFSPEAGLSFLETIRISRHSADQRAGRAGRTAPGKSIRLFSEKEYRAFRESDIAEITDCDLSELLLQVAARGSSVEALDFLDAPPRGNIITGQALLREIGAFDDKNQLTPLGREIAELPIHPRLGAMLIKAQTLGLGSTACDIAALLEEKIPHQTSPDLRHHLYDIGKNRNAQLLADKLRRQLDCKKTPPETEFAGLLISFAFPMWIAKRRGANSNRYLLAASGGAEIPVAMDGFNGEYLAVARLDGSKSANSAIRLAAPITLEEIENHFSNHITCDTKLSISDDGKAIASKIFKLGEITLKSTAIPPPDAAKKVLIEEMFKRKLPLPPAEKVAACALLSRVRFAHALEPDNYPDWSENLWQQIVAESAVNFLGDARSFADIANADWGKVLRQLLGEEVYRKLDHYFPAKFRTPAGAEHLIDYDGETPTVRAKVQEFYGVSQHPVVGENRLPLRVELLSPAGRPVQISCDLPGFWRGSWALVKKEMASRYPKHFWPDDPLGATATMRTLKPKNNGD